MEIAGFTAVPDHHFYTPRELAEIGERVKTAGEDVTVITTEKDWVKLEKSASFSKVFIISVGMAFINEEEVEIDTADVDSTLAAKVEVLDVIPQAVFTGENALNDQIAKYFPNYFSNVRALIDVEPCS